MIHGNNFGKVWQNIRCFRMYADIMNAGKFLEGSNVLGIFWINSRFWSKSSLSLFSVWTYECSFRTVWVALVCWFTPPHYSLQLTGKSLFQKDRQVSRNLIECYNRERESMIQMEPPEVFAARVCFDRKLQNQMQVVKDVYTQSEAMGRAWQLWWYRAIQKVST